MSRPKSTRAFLWKSFGQRSHRQELRQELNALPELTWFQVEFERGGRLC
jgi:hypothetical protein